MRKRIRLIVPGSVLVALIGAIFFGGQPQPSSGQQVQPTINLTGLWKYMDGSTVRIEHNTRTQSVTAKFVPPYSCPSGYATIDRLFDGQLDGAKLSGNWMSCNDKLLVDACGKAPTFPGDFTATVSQKEISGKYYLPYFTWTGSCQGFKISTTVDPYLPLTLTRDCNPDLDQLCDTLANASTQQPARTPQTALTPADLVLRAESAPDKARRGEKIGYKFEIKNKGPADAQGVIFTVALGSADLIEANASQGECTRTGSSVTCKLGVLNEADTANVTLRLTPRVAGMLRSTARVYSASPDPDMSNNVENVTVRIQPKTRRP